MQAIKIFGKKIGNVLFILIYLFMGFLRNRNWTNKNNIEHFIIGQFIDDWRQNFLKKYCLMVIKLPHSTVSVKHTQKIFQLFQLNSLKYV